MLVRRTYTPRVVAADISVLGEARTLISVSLDVTAVEHAFVTFPVHLSGICVCLDFGAHIIRH